MRRAVLAALSVMAIATACRTGSLLLDETPADCGPESICSLGGRDPAVGEAIELSLGQPSGMAMDADGNLYLADPVHAVIRKLHANGTLEVIAGTGRSALTRTGLPPLDTDLAAPNTVAACPDGWIFFATWFGDGRLYGIDPETDIVIDVASGIPFRTAQHLHCDTDGNLWIPHAQYGRVLVWNRGTTDLVLPTITIAPGQQGYAAGSGACCNPTEGNALVASLNDVRQAIPRADGSFVVLHGIRAALVYGTGLIGTIANAGGASGNGGDGGPATLAQWYYVVGAAVDGDRLFLVGNNRLRVMNLGTAAFSYLGNTVQPGNIAGITGVLGRTTFFGDGTSALQQELGLDYTNPLIDAQGGVILADAPNGLLRRVDPVSGIMTAVAGLAGGGDPETYLPIPTDIAIGPDGRAIVTSRGVHLVAIGGNGAGESIAGKNSPVSSGDGGLATEAGLFAAAGVVAAPDGTVYFSDARNHFVRRIDPDGRIFTIAGNGSAPDGGTGDGGPALAAGLEGPGSLTLDSSGNLFIVDHTKIRVLNVGPAPITVAGVTIAPGAIDRIAGNGNADAYGGDNGPALTALFATHHSDPSGIAIYDGALYVADSHNSRIRKIDLASGIVTTVVGNGIYGYGGDGQRPSDALLGEVTGLAVHDGWLYWSQYEGAAVRRISLLTTNATVLPVAGNGTRGYSGDGGPAVQAQLSNPWEIDVGPDGRVYVVDGSHRVRVIRP